MRDAAAQPNPPYNDNADPVGSEGHFLELDIYIAEAVTNAKTVLMYIHRIVARTTMVGKQDNMHCQDVYRQDIDLPS